jgi:hypothetical protein
MEVMSENCKLRYTVLQPFWGKTNCPVALSKKSAYAIEADYQKITF